MLVNIEIIEKPEISTNATFQLADLNSPKAYKETVAIIFMLAAEYHLDPELDVSDIEGYVKDAHEKTKVKMTLNISEEGLELEFL